MNIILCGMPKSGKTTLGQLAATRLNRTFIDTDRVIEAMYHSATGESLACHEIYRKEGSEAFRYLEQQAIATLKTAKSCIIAVGGGALQNAKNLNILRRLGMLIYLQADTKVLLERILARRIPAYLDALHPEQSLEQLHEERTQTFEQSAHKIINTENLSTDQIVEMICSTE
ncbi:MAG: AAA family ATPase [Chlamydiia bacterium]|nr:AAA family ATPase [Chlamydiia bacterium]